MAADRPHGPCQVLPGRDQRARSAPSSPTRRCSQPRIIRTGYDASPTDASQARRGRQGGAGRRTKPPRGHAQPATESAICHGHAGEESPVLSRAAFRRPQRKGAPVMGSALHRHRRIIRLKVGDQGASAIHNPSRGPPYTEPIGQSSIAPQRHAARVGRGARLAIRPGNLTAGDRQSDPAGLSVPRSAALPRAVSLTRYRRSAARPAPRRARAGARPRPARQLAGHDVVAAAGTGVRRDRQQPRPSNR